MNERILSAGTAQDISDDRGIVLANFGHSALVQTAAGTVHCGIRGRKLRVVCGDHIRWKRPIDDDRTTIESVEERSNVLERIDSRGRPEAIASNIDRLAIVIAPEPKPDWFILDRYLASAQLKEIRALLILNKCDLDVSGVRTELAVYRRFNVECHEVIARSPETLGPVRASIQDCTTMLVGQSGVGKSSLINALMQDAPAQTAALSRDAQGRHTTTTARRYQLDTKSFLIDAPGVRDFAPPAGYDRAAERGFVEIHAASVGCRFNDCRHFDEPNCAVRRGVTAGDIDSRRYESYRRLLRLFDSFADR